MENSTEIPQKLKTELPYDTTMLLCSIYVEKIIETKSKLYKKFRLLYKIVSDTEEEKAVRRK